MRSIPPLRSRHGLPSLCGWEAPLQRRSQYWRATSDDDFFLCAGAEILLDTARFWASRAAAEADNRRHIRHVIGPDEYHEDVDDNAFTNVMARWNIARALEAMDLLRARWPDRAAALREKLVLGDDELADWHDAVARIVVGLDPATGIYEQFAGFHALARSTSPPTPTAPFPSTW